MVDNMNNKINIGFVMGIAFILILSSFVLAFTAVGDSNDDLVGYDTQVQAPIDIDPPVEGGETFRSKAQNAASHGAASFLWVEGYEPWAALVINAGDPRGVDTVTASFEDDTLRIEATDDNNTNHVSILINKEFADEHLADAEGDLDIEFSDAVNYQGLDNSNASAGGGAVYVFHIEHFSTQWIEMSAEDSIPFLGVPLLLLAGAVPVAIYTYKKKLS